MVLQITRILTNIQNIIKMSVGRKKLKTMVYNIKDCIFVRVPRTDAIMVEDINDYG